MPRRRWRSRLSRLLHTFAEALEPAPGGSDLSYSDASGVDLSGVDPSGMDLTGAPPEWADRVRGAAERTGGLNRVGLSRVDLNHVGSGTTGTTPEMPPRSAAERAPLVPEPSPRFAPSDRGTASASATRAADARAQSSAWEGWRSRIAHGPLVVPRWLGGRAFRTRTAASARGTSSEFEPTQFEPTQFERTQFERTQFETTQFEPTQFEPGPTPVPADPPVAPSNVSPPSDPVPRIGSPLVRPVPLRSEEPHRSEPTPIGSSSHAPSMQPSPFPAPLEPPLESAHHALLRLVPPTPPRRRGIREHPPAPPRERAEPPTQPEPPAQPTPPAQPPAPAITGLWPELPVRPPTTFQGPALEPSLRRLTRLAREQAAT